MCSIDGFWPIMLWYRKWGWLFKGWLSQQPAHVLHLKGFDFRGKSGPGCSNFVTILALNQLDLTEGFNAKLVTTFLLNN
jgi:hypothetical protein